MAGVRLRWWAAAFGVVVATAISTRASCALAATSVPPSRAAASSASQPALGRAHGHAHGHDDDAGSTLQSLAERRRLLSAGEASLANGDIDGARRAFEQAANMAHSAEIELGILRTQMQAGEYRQALAFAAHTAGVHLDDVEGAAFYAWLLNLGGQVAVADQTLQQAEARAPDHPLLRLVRERLQSGVMLASGALRHGPARLAPYSSGASGEFVRAVPGAIPSADAAVVASALLLADGRHALVPRAALPAANPGLGVIWLRNGMGQMVAAKVAEPDQAPGVTQDEAPLRDQSMGDDLGLALLTLTVPLPVAGGEIVPPRDAFPGSPAFAMDYPLDVAGQAAWPVLRPGFVGSLMAGARAVQRLGVELPGQGGPRGGPVYDQGGRLLGLAMGPAVGHAAPGTAQAHQPDQLLPISALRRQFGERFGTPATELRPAPVGADELYERAMRTTLQVLLTTPAP
jgi:hypothetical protein